MCNNAIDGILADGLQYVGIFYWREDKIVLQLLAEGNVSELR